MKTRKPAPTRLLIAACAALVATGLATGTTSAAATDPAPPPDQTAPPWSPDQALDVPDGDVEARMAHEDISRAEALHRFDVERAAAALRREATSRWPDTFAGIWLDVEPFGVTVAFTRDAAAHVADLAADFPYPDDLRATTSPRSLTTLTELQERMRTDRTALQAGEVSQLPAAIRATEGVYDLGTDIRSARVTVRVEQATDAVRQAFHNAYSPAIAVSEGVSKPAACRIGDCRYAMMGGLRLQLGTRSGFCSSAFTNVANGNRSVLSAGHCYTTTNATSRYHADSYYGYTDDYRYGGALDAERIRRNNSTWRESSKFFVQGEDPRMVSAFQKYGDMVVGTYIGKTGENTGTTRGYLTDRNVSPNKVPNGWGFLAADLCSAHGDSGGAVWRGTVAWGIVHGHFENTSCRGSNRGGKVVFGAIGRALHHLGGLLYNVNLAPTADFTHSCDLLMNCDFRGGPSDDPDGSIQSYRWDFYDGTTKWGKNVSKSYSLPGIYVVELRVKDNNGKTNTVTKAITVP